MDPQTVATRVSMRAGDAHDIPFAEQVGHQNLEAELLIAFWAGTVGF